MFERFTDGARQVVVLAQEAARRLGHDEIGSEHLLVALAEEGRGIAARALASFGMSAATVSRRVAEITPDAGAERRRRSRGGPRQILFTAGLKQVLEGALREALELRHGYVGTEHVLLALVAAPGEVAGQVLADAGATRERVRAEVEALLKGYGVGEQAADVLEGKRAAAAAPAPVCASCGTELEGNLTVVMLEATVAGAERATADVRLVACTACGAAIGRI